MIREEIYDTLKTIIVKEFEIEEDKITMESKFYDDLEMDSINIVDLFVSMEEKFEINVEDVIEYIESLNTVGDLVKYIESKGK